MKKLYEKNELTVFRTLPIKQKCITAQPLIERVNLEPYLDGVELVVVGGESDRDARPLDYDWVLDIREQCIRKQANFEFRQCGTHFIKAGKLYKLQTKDLCKQARLAGINDKCEPRKCFLSIQSAAILSAADRLESAGGIHEP